MAVSLAVDLVAWKVAERAVLSVARRAVSMGKLSAALLASEMVGLTAPSKVATLDTIEVVSMVGWTVHNWVESSVLNEEIETVAMMVSAWASSLVALLEI